MGLSKSIRKKLNLVAKAETGAQKEGQQVQPASPMIFVRKELKRWIEEQLEQMDYKEYEASMRAQKIDTYANLEGFKTAQEDGFSPMQNFRHARREGFLPKIRVKTNPRSKRIWTILRFNFAYHAIIQSEGIGNKTLNPRDIILADKKKKVRTKKVRPRKKSTSKKVVKKGNK